MRIAASIIVDGGIVAYPTEAIWGLGCDPWNEMAVQRLLHLKARPAGKGLILVAASTQQFAWLVEDLPAALRARLDLSWPGPTTWLVPHQNRVPDWISGSHATVAIRVSPHPRVRELCEAVGFPIVSTSANVAGMREARQQFQVRKYFRGGVDYLLPGPTGARSRPSTIRDLISDTVVRQG